MKGLVLADLHISQNKVSFEKLRRMSEIDFNPDFVLLAGDNAEVGNSLFSNHTALFDSLKTRFDCPIGFVAGNHDLYGRDLGISSKDILNQIFPQFARDFEIIYLEKKNMQVGDVTIAGTYGHYDYSLGNIRGQVTLEAVKKGVFGKLAWLDKFRMNLKGQTDESFCDSLVSGLEGRLKQEDSKLITLSHTVPAKELIGYPDSVEQDFLGCYGGSTKIADLIKKYNPIFHFCGHTHRPSQTQIGQTKVFNVGADYDLLRYAFVDTDTLKVDFTEVKF